ncbi:MAG: hypothetical protein H6812_01505 [Phycisphaeraceae bacterium]|nr:hypothetical protein [Phycisphaerales bacterium]MCB9841911.1 hypothetical protein [Phycisphaeraceae bacterium]
MSTFARLVVCVVLALFVCAEALAGKVTVTLRDGRVFTGFVHEETEFKIVLDVPFSGITSRMTFAMRDVDTITREEDKEAGSPVDGGDGADESGDAPTDDANTDAQRAGGYVVIPAHGGVGVELTADYFDDVLNRAVRCGAEVAIIHVDSPGGLVAELDAIRDVLDRYEDKITIAFYVDNEAFSAAALLCMSGKHLYIGKRASIGAAVAFSGSVGNYKVDAKFNSAFAAKWRGRAEEVGRPGLLIDAMILPETEVYAEKSTEPWTLSPDKPSKGDGAEWQTLDNKREILSLTHLTATGTGAVNGSADSAHDVAALIGVERNQAASFDGERYAASYYASQERNINTVVAALESYVEVLDTLKDSKDLRQYRERLEKLNRTIGQVSRLYNKHDYVRNIFLLEGVSIDAFRAIQDRIREILRDL